MSLEEHQRDSVKNGKFAIVTTSDRRTKETDESGEIIQKILENSGHEVLSHKIIPNIKEEILKELDRFLSSEAQCLITTGGTGVSSRDITIETLSAQFEKTLNGFGELFRRLSFEEIGTATILSRATAGIIKKKLIFVLPGSPRAVKLAMEKIIILEVGHILGQLQK